MIIEKYKTIYNKLIDFTNKAHLHLENLKEIVEKLQNERNYFKSKVNLLIIEKERLHTSNKNLMNKVKCLEEKVESLRSVKNIYVI